MLSFIDQYPNAYEAYFNDDIIYGGQDTPIVDLMIQAMSETEAIENVHIEGIEVIPDQDEVDINQHMININFKKKNLSAIEIPKFKYMAVSRYGEIVFTIRITTNLNEKIIVKRLLYPIEHDGFYYNNGKRMKAIWQVVDASTYSQRGKQTLKSRMPTIIYQNRKRVFVDVEGVEHVMTSYSYALNSKTRRPGSKTHTRFINPLMIYFAKIGFKLTRAFFGMADIVEVVTQYNEEELEEHYIFQVDAVFVKVKKEMFDEYELVRSFVCMFCNCRSKIFPVEEISLEDKEYWVCRIGTVGAARNKNILSFKEKGTTTIYMSERLLDKKTINNLRLPMYYKQNIYFLMYWMMTNFQELRRFANIDMRNKRIRRNEYIVDSTLGKKINENINRIIEKRGKSKMNTMDTLLELFNFNSDIVVSGMRNLNDVIKSDDIVNDMDFILDLAYSNKGPNSLGESNSKMIATKYRYLHPSMVGVVDLNVSSNSDVGMSGSFVPYVKLYDGFYFTPEHEPCQARYQFDKSIAEKHGLPTIAPTGTFDMYAEGLRKDNPYADLLKYEKIEIVEKEPETITRKKDTNES